MTKKQPPETYRKPVLDVVFLESGPVCLNTSGTFNEDFEFDEEIEII